ncbi:caspase-like [Periplaneta americana]|uniref:caspase-like n=1 Tax=Periplaneta americana TaxID=6978 RepID=UPI0037E8B25B
MESEDIQELNGREMAVQSMSETDAWIFKSSSRRHKDDTEPLGVQDATDVSPLPARGSGCDRDAEEYNMKHPRRGVALIFNHEKFDRMPARTGSSKDCANLSHELKELGFEVRSHKDLSYVEMAAILNETSKEDHSLADCLMVVVMSHGDPGYLHTRDTVYQTQELWMRFTGNKCPSLIGKPKLFFIQACRGTQVDSGVAVDQVDGYTMSYMIPTHADILIAYSTVEGHYSWRNPRQGSWFIQALCQELSTNGRTRDLMTLLTFVCRRVAIDYQSFVPGDEGMDRKKQVPTITSMLTRLIYFR